jgi:ATP-dependent Clp protease ATP-binding subunit ClpA
MVDFTDGARRALQRSKAAAIERSANEILPAHILLGLCESQASAAEELATAGINSGKLIELLDEAKPNPASSDIPFSRSAKAILEDSVRLAVSAPDGASEVVSTSNLLAALRRCEDPTWQEFLTTSKLQV